MISTLRSSFSDAEICRRKGWQVGDVLEGKEYGQTSRIQITAIGEEGILARELITGEREMLWTLSCREWKKIVFD